MAAAYSAVWKRPGTTLCSWIRNRVVCWYRATVCGPRTRFMPARLCRRNSRYADSTVRRVATRSGTWSSARQARHHERMSSSDGDCTPCSILLTRVKCCPVAAASARPVRPAALRSSRSRTPSACCASFAELDGLVFTVRDRQSPGGVECRCAESNVGGVCRGDAVRRQTVAGVREEHDQAVVEQIEVVAGKGDRRHQSPRHPTNVFAGGNHRVSDGVRPTLVVAQRLRHDTQPPHRATGVSMLSKGLTPSLEPLQIIWFARCPLRQVRQFDRGAVGVTHLQVDRFAFESHQQLLELFFRYRGHDPPA